MTYLTLWVAITIFVLVSQCKLFWEVLLNLLVGEFLTNTLRERNGVLRESKRSSTWSAVTYCVDLIESLPLLILDPQSLSSLDGSLHVTRPNLQLASSLTPNEGAQSVGVLEENGQ